MKGGLPKSEQTVAELLHAGDYWSMHVGKWHLGMDDGYLPTQRGFDRYFGVPHGLGKQSLILTRSSPDPH